MRSILIILMGIFLLVPKEAIAKVIHVDEQWGEGDDRSALSAPELSIDDQAIYVYSVKSLDNICITIKDLSGNILFTETTVIPGDTKYPILISNLEEGEYLVSITQDTKYIIGYFTK